MLARVFVLAVLSVSRLAALAASPGSRGRAKATSAGRAARSARPLLAAAGALKDPQAIAIISQSLVAVGGTALLATLQDFTATGTVTFFWAGQPAPGPATVLGRGTTEFRLDANLTAGMRSYAVMYGTGALKDTTGAVTPIPLHDTINIGVLSFPCWGLAAALADPTVAISYMGSVGNGSGGQLYQVRLQRQFTSAADPTGILTSLCVTDYFFDSQTYLLAKTVDQTHPVETWLENYSHEIDFSNYATAATGVNVPMLAQELVGGQMTWQVQLSGINFNTGLTDANFQLQ